jgi:hypothetical protein
MRARPEVDTAGIAPPSPARASRYPEGLIHSHGGMVNGDAAGHAFISYIHEDVRAAEWIHKTLEAVGIQVWRDTEHLWPGEDWKIRIRDAITRNTLAFIACFSDHSVARQKTYQSEELLLAIDEFRQRQPGQPWLIPVRLSESKLPAFDLGGGRTLDSLHRVDLFGEHWAGGADRLIAGVLRALPTERHGRVASTTNFSPLMEMTDFGPSTRAGTGFTSNLSQEQESGEFLEFADPSPVKWWCDHSRWFRFGLPAGWEALSEQQRRELTPGIGGVIPDAWAVLEEPVPTGVVGADIKARRYMDLKVRSARQLWN